MCNLEQESIEQNICELLQQIKGCCTSKEEIDNIKLQLDSIQLWINSFEEGIPKTNNILLSSAIGEVDTNSTLQDVLEYLYNLIDNIQLEGSVNLSISNRNTNTLDIIPSSGNGTTIPSVTTSLSGLMTSTDKVKLNGIQEGATVNVQADWSVSDNTSDAFIKNKPTIPSISGLATESYVNNGLSTKQDVLVSGTNLKSVNNQSLIGSGNLNISSGEINTASNLGITGEGLFKQKIGVNLEFKKINAGSNKINIISDSEKIDVDVNVSNLTGISQSQITNLVNDLSLKAPLDSPSFTGAVTGVTKSMVGLGNVDNTPDLSKPISTLTQNALNLKQKVIQIQNEGTNLGSAGVVETINFTGANINATLVGNILTVDVTGGSGGGATNLDYIPSPTQGTVTSDTGLDATLPLATGTNAGLLSPSGFTKLENISVTQAVDLDQLEADTVINNTKISNVTHTGDVTGSTVLTLATVNSNVGSFGSSTQIPQLTVNSKGLVTAVSNVTITPSASSITGAGNITKVDDNNVTLTLGGTPIGSVLSNVSFTLGWSGTLSVARGGTGLSTLGTANQQLRVNAGGTALEYFTPSSNGILTLNGLSSSSQTFTNDSNVTIVSAGSTHTITWVGSLADNRISSSSNWNSAYSNRITSLTTTGNSGASTLVSNVLNIPNYTLSGLGGQPLSANLTSLSSLSYVSNSFVKFTAAGTFSLDTNNYYLASNPSGYTNNTGTVTSVSALTIGTTGTDITSSVVNNTTTPVITLNIPTASASNRGALSSTDWTIFNSKQSAITLTTTGTSGAATFISNILNIPTYTLSGLGGQAALTGTGIVKSTGGTISYVTDNSTTWDKSYQQNKIRVVSTNTTLSATTDGTVVFDTASTIATLPTSVNETILVVKNNSGGTITVSGHIDGIASSNYVLQTRESMKFHGNGTTWYYIG